MRVACLFSGGVDSTLAALLLAPHCEVVLVTGSFGLADRLEGPADDGDAPQDGRLADQAAPAPDMAPDLATPIPDLATPIPDPVATAAAVADALDLPHRGVDLDPAVADEAVERLVADGYPRDAIQPVHEHALEVVAGRVAREADPPFDAPFDAVADGTRRDDRVPRLDRAAAQSLEDRHGVDYLRPLAGVGRHAVDALAADLLTVERGPSEAVASADYETELRALLAARHGDDAVAEIFPDHVQSRVTGRR